MLANGSARALDGHQRGNWTAVPGDNRGLALRGGVEKFRKLIARFFRAFANHGPHLCFKLPYSTVQNMVKGNPAQDEVAPSAAIR